MERTRKKIRILILIGVLLILGFIINYLVAAFVLSGRASLSGPLSDVPDDREVCVTMEVPKEWGVGMQYGAEYDFTLHNNLNLEISNWTVELPLTEDIIPINPDEIWNVSFDQKPDKLTLTALDYASVVKGKDVQTFGVIVVGDKWWAPETVTVSYEKVYQAMELPSFFVLMVLTILWGMFMVEAVSVYFTQRKEQLRARQDKQIILQSINTFINFIDAKDPYTQGHSKRVATIAVELARRLGFPEDKIDHIYYTGLLHDAGKISIPDRILKKVGRLTPEEYSVMQQHPDNGGLMLKDFTVVDEIRDGALYHHERYDGKGYPQKLKGEEIPLAGRIICVADSFDAMARDRCYRKHLTAEQILSEFENNSGTQFDPEIVIHMIRMIKDGTAERLTAEL